jgi:hypothetical protein
VPGAFLFRAEVFFNEKDVLELRFLTGMQPGPGIDSGDARTVWGTL